MSDPKNPYSAVFISGMGRSGTTWLSEVINHDHSYRDMFEPFSAPRESGIDPFFSPHQYIRPDNQNAELTNRALKILAGETGNRWIDQNNQNFNSRKRVIKDIRANLMLEWLHTIEPDMPIVLIIRHPLSVARSWQRLGWGIPGTTGTSDFNNTINQQDLLSDFPIIADNLGKIDHTSHLERIIFLWCILNYVPIRQLGNNDYLLVFHETLLLDPEREFNRVFRYVGSENHYVNIKNISLQRSRTSYHDTDLAALPSVLVQKWTEHYSSCEISRVDEILEGFGLDMLYNKQGIPQAPSFGF